MPRLPILAAVAFLAIAVVGAGTWYFVFRGDEPPPVSLAGAVSAVSGTATATGAALTSTPAATATEASATSAGASDSSSTAEGVASAGTLEGTWTVDAEGSFVGYRVEEELSSIGSTTAVGRTSVVTGTLEFDGASITGVSITADLTQLRSDDSRRDGQLRRQALETNEFPEATFVLAEPIAVEGDPASGDTIAATAVGDLTLHGVTNRVSIPLEGALVDGAVVVVGSVVVALADYEIDPPRAPIVLSVADEATIEMQLVFRQA